MFHRKPSNHETFHEMEIRRTVHPKFSSRMLFLRVCKRIETQMREAFSWKPSQTTCL